MAQLLRLNRQEFQWVTLIAVLFFLLVEAHAASPVALEAFNADGASLGKATVTTITSSTFVNGAVKYSVGTGPKVIQLWSVAWHMAWMP